MAKAEKRERSMALYETILKLKDLDECCRFFDDLCTPTELRSLEQRFDVAVYLQQGLVYLDILDKTGASSATISRVRRSMLDNGAGGVMQRPRGPGSRFCDRGRRPGGVPGRYGHHHHRAADRAGGGAPGPPRGLCTTPADLSVDRQTGPTPGGKGWQLWRTCTGHLMGGMAQTTQGSNRKNTWSRRKWRQSGGGNLRPPWTGSRRWPSCWERTPKKWSGRPPCWRRPLQWTEPPHYTMSQISV